MVLHHENEILIGRCSDGIVLRDRCFLRGPLPKDSPNSDKLKAPIYGSDRMKKKSGRREVKSCNSTYQKHISKDIELGLIHF